MLFNDEVVLVGVSGYTVNALHDQVPILAERTILANRKSIRQSEFYQAQATGLQPELTFVVWACEYEGERKLIYAGREYSIIRTYETKDELIELVCSGLVGP